MEQVHVGADGLTLLACPECGDERAFEQPPCQDGHGMDCPDRACVECGTAVFLDPPIFLDPSASSTPRPVASRPSRVGVARRDRPAGSPVRDQRYHVA
ncbi:hypothetical protein [Frankia sp. Cppng1_Ct_nod]|uniref:hypothetical protein n=1 Tax=Frankia sp. Cppng1_Ct_nod TaxID=2897162 RepID=UPI001041AB04|nr:hypothetical protein [Frankia sp. Cppng1_Ct_nod]